MLEAGFFTASLQVYLSTKERKRADPDPTVEGVDVGEAHAVVEMEHTGQAEGRAGHGQTLEHKVDDLDGGVVEGVAKDTVCHQSCTKWERCTIP